MKSKGATLQGGGDAKFAERLEEASQIVSSWPTWKQKVLGDVESHGKAIESVDVFESSQEVLGRVCKLGKRPNV